VVVKRPLDLDTIADLAGVPAEEVRELNPALLARITPPVGDYALRLPEGAGARFDVALREAPASRLVSWGIHRVGRHQSLTDIARLYRVTPQRLAEVNPPLPGGRLRGVTEVVVPLSNKGLPPSSPGSAVAAREPARPKGAGGAREVVVRRGDTLWGIGNRYGVKPDVLAQLNGIDIADPLPAGARLRVSTP
jgi:hypothetical protein